MKISFFYSFFGLISGYTISAISHRSQLKGSKTAYNAGNVKITYKYVAVPKMLKMSTRGELRQNRSTNKRFNRFRSHHCGKY